MSLHDKYEPVPESGCWLWSASTDRVGYGHIWVDGKLLQAHRYSWQLHNGPIPDGAKILHKCDVRSCVNPAHLFLGDQKENVKDAVSKRRWGSRPRKITADVARSIKQLSEAGKSAAEIARSLGLGFSLVYQVVIGRTWKHA